jgi:hypothetical protein
MICSLVDCEYNLLMGIKESKIQYFDGSYFEGETNAAGK